MQNSLRTFLAHRTVVRLRDSIQVKGPLPGLASAVRLIQLAEERRKGDDSDIVKAVLADPSLMQKVLRLANSSMYATFGGAVDNISRALAILGTETVAHLAFSQTLLDNFKPCASNVETVARMESASLAGHMARQFSKDSRGKDVETAVICALMHSMGRLLLEFYLPNDGVQLRTMMRESGMSEDEVATQLLGLNLESLGLETAKEWRMPQSILAGLRHVSAVGATEPVSGTDRLAAISTLAHQCAETLQQGATTTSQAKLLELTTGYSGMLGISPELLLSDVVEARAQASAERAVAVAQHSGAEPAASQSSSQLLGQMDEGSAIMRDQTGTLTPGQALSIAAESLFKGLALSRSFIFIRKGNGYSARLGLGAGAKALVSSLQFEDTGGPDVVRTAMHLDQVMYVRDTSAPAPGSQLPDWWFKPLGAARSVIMIPILVNQKPLGFIYGEWQSAGASVALTPAEMEAVDRLRRTLLRAVVAPSVSTMASRAPAGRTTPISAFGGTTAKTKEAIRGHSAAC